LDEKSEPGTQTLEEPVVATRFEVGPYQVVDEVGRGGMGVVYRALHRELDREVALKRPREDKVDNPRARRRFLREARAAARLIHPGIATIFDVFEADGVPWLAMEMVDGRRLSAVLGDGTLAVEDVVRHGEVLADALAAAHDAGVLHRDVNPNNVLIGRDGRARLTDFGLARTVEPEPGSMCTETGMVVGTRGYMSPEQAMGKTLDGRSDVFCLGLVLYEMATGVRAFGRGDTGEWIDHLLHREPTPLATHDSTLPEELVRIIDKALAKRPDERYGSAAELRDDLKSLRRSVESEVFVVPTIAQRRRRRWSWAAAAVVAVTAFAAVWVTALRRQQPAPLNWTPKQLTSAPGWEGEPALSPDGTLVAYASDESGTADIWLMDAAGGEAVRLTHHPATDRAPAWLPDGSAVLFTSMRMGDPGIWRVPRLGGTAVEVVADAEEVAVSPDGRSIAFARKDASGDLRVVVAPIDDPLATEVLTGPAHGTWYQTEPDWSPDGTSLVYRSAVNLWLIPARGGAGRPLTTDEAAYLDPAWSPGGRWIYAASFKDQGTTALWRVSISDRSAQRLTMGTGPERHPSLASRGGRVAYSTSTSNRDVEVLDRATGERWRLPGRRGEIDPAFAAGRGVLLFSSNRGGEFDLWAQPLVGAKPHGEPRRLTDLPGNAIMPTVSPDGRLVAFNRNGGGVNGVWVIPVTGGRTVAITETSGYSSHPAWSHDGGRLAYISSADGREHVWVVGVDGDGRRSGEPYQVTWGDSVDLFPEWLPSETIAFIRRQAGRSEVWLVDLGSGDARPLTDGARAEKVCWDPGSSELLVSGRWEHGRLSVRSVSVPDGVTRRIEAEPVFGSIQTVADLEVSPEGRLLAYMVEDAVGDVWVAAVSAGEL
jgi:Tol biopolymer transport system component